MRRTVAHGSATKGPRVWSAADVAELLDVPAARVVWHCQRAQALGAGALFFGAMERDGEWMLPDRVVRRAVREWQDVHYSVARVAALADVSERQVRDRLRVVPAGLALEQGRAEWQIGARLFFGTQIRVPESEVRRLAEGRVTARPAAA